MFFDTEHKGWHSRGYLRHLDVPVTIQAVTFRLWDSLPSRVVAKLVEEEMPDLRRRRIADLLDAGHGSCMLRNATAARGRTAGCARCRMGTGTEVAAPRGRRHRDRA